MIPFLVNNEHIVDDGVGDRRDGRRIGHDTLDELVPLLFVGLHGVVELRLPLSDDGIGVEGVLDQCRQRTCTRTDGVSDVGGGDVHGRWKTEERIQSRDVRRVR